MSNRFPNANYPVPYTEANMAKADGIAVNADGTGLTVTDVSAPYGPLYEGAVTGADVDGTTLHGNKPAATVTEKSAPAEEPEAAPKEPMVMSFEDE